MANLINFTIVAIYFFFIVLYFNQNVDLKNKIIIRKIRNEYFLIIFFLSFFFMISPIFSYQYFPDQSKFLRFTQSLQELDLYRVFQIEKQYINTIYASVFYALFPLFYVEDTSSIALINRFLFIFVIYFCYKKNFFNIKFVIFILFIPFFFIYSNVALKESLNFFLIFFIFYYFFKKNFLFLLFLITLYFTGINAFYITSFFLISYISFNKFSYLINYILFFITILIIGFYEEEIFNVLNTKYIGYYNEQWNMSVNIFNQFDYNPRKIEDLIYFLLNTPEFFLKSFFNFFYPKDIDVNVSLINRLYLFLNFIFINLLTIINILYSRNIEKKFFFIIFTCFYFSFSLIGYLIQNPLTLDRYLLTPIICANLLIFFSKWSRKNNFL